MGNKFCILRTAKLTSNGNVASSLAHSFRERETKNADKSLFSHNQYLGGKTAGEVMERYKQLLPPEFRSNAVRCIEYVITASPDALESLSKADRLEFFKNSLNWINEKHKNGVFFSCIHRDESSEHLVAMVVPLDEKGHLNARSFLGGAKKLSEMQTSFYEKVGKKYGFDRGLMGSKSKHQTIKDYYGKVEEMEKALKPPKRKLLENDKDYAERYKAQLRPLFKIALDAERIQQRNEQIEEHLAKSKKGFREFTTFTDGLFPDQIKYLQDIVATMRQKNAETLENEVENENNLKPKPPKSIKR